MIVKQLIDEDFSNYKIPTMTIGFPKCTFKCDKECGMSVCQNSALASAPNIEVDIHYLVKRYIDNPITKAVCFQGLEPFDSKEIYLLSKCFRLKTNDDIVIYTGYTKEELNKMGCLARIKTSVKNNLIIKFGRFIPGQNLHYDEVLGVKLASDNQYAERVC